MRVTVIGCGNAGLVHAAKLVEHGHEVCLLKTSNTRAVFYEEMYRVGGYFVSDDTNEGNGMLWECQPTMITRDEAKAVKFADVIMVMCVTTRHWDVAQRIAPYVRDGQIIALVPGYMGSLIFKKYIKKDVIYAEWETTAYNGRIIDNKYVSITFRNVRNAISTLPVRVTDKIVKTFASLFPNTCYARKNILESTMHQPNMVLHPIGMIFSASKIESSNGNFWMYKEAYTPSVINTINEFDKAKNAILRAFNCTPVSFFKDDEWRGDEDTTIDPIEAFLSFGEYSNKGPASLYHRYLIEDVPMGLVLFVSIAEAIGVDASFQRGLISMASALLNQNFFSSARRIECLLDKSRVSMYNIQQAISD